ncbi:MAG: hypothetical protein HY356_01600 [Gammaproteobacteria bacterium]|nr:hypothetical protein [Gammaproteobacteria bacterium]
MKNGISMMAAGHATSLFLAITFSLCVALDLVLPFAEHPMSELWLTLLPGFEWISSKGYLIGFAESYAYGWYFAVLWVWLYNLFLRRGGN